MPGRLRRSSAARWGSSRSTRDRSSGSVRRSRPRETTPARGRRSARAAAATASLRRGGRASEATLAEALSLAARGEDDAALHALQEVLDRADLPFTGWTIPIEPLLDRVRQMRGYKAIAQRLADQAR